MIVVFVFMTFSDVLVPTHRHKQNGYTEVRTYLFIIKINIQNLSSYLISEETGKNKTLKTCLRCYKACPHSVFSTVSTIGELVEKVIYATGIIPFFGGGRSIY